MILSVGEKVENPELQNYLLYLPVKEIWFSVDTQDLVNTNIPNIRLSISTDQEETIYGVSSPATTYTGIKFVLDSNLDLELVDGTIVEREFPDSLEYFVDGQCSSATSQNGFEDSKSSLHFTVENGSLDNSFDSTNVKQNAVMLHLKPQLSVDSTILTLCAWATVGASQSAK